jgi:hypothetical protein
MSVSIHKNHFLGLVLACVLGHTTALIGATPEDFPACTVTTYDPDSTGNGYIFLEVTDPGTNAGFYVMILENDGTPVWYQKRTNRLAEYKKAVDLIHSCGMVVFGSFMFGADVETAAVFEETKRAVDELEVDVIDFCI